MRAYTKYSKRAAFYNSHMELSAKEQHFPTKSIDTNGNCYQDIDITRLNSYTRPDRTASSTAFADFSGREIRRAWEEARVSR